MFIFYEEMSKCSIIYVFASDPVKKCFFFISVIKVYREVYIYACLYLR